MTSSGLSSSSAGTGLRSQMAMSLGSMTRVRRSTRATARRGASARSPVGARVPASQARAVVAAAPVARPMSASLRWPTSFTNAASRANGDGFVAGRATRRGHPCWADGGAEARNVLVGRIQAVFELSNRRVRGIERLRRRAGAGPCPRDAGPQLPNSAITSSSIASDGRHSTRARLARSASGSNRPSSRAREGRPELGCGHELGTVDQGPGGRRDGDALVDRHVVRMKRRPAVDHDARGRGIDARVVCGSGHEHVDRLVVFPAWRLRRSALASHDRP